jgi:hypothetical protein
MPDKPSLKRRVATAGGKHLALRLLKPIPVVGTAVTIGLAGRDIRNKGLLRGAVHVGLDVTPFVGTAKGILEIFTGDLIPDKKPKKGKRLPGRPEK